MIDYLAAGLAILGALLAFAAGLGILRFPDTLTRMHPATKPQVLGLILTLTAAAIRVRGHLDVGMIILAGFFAILTAPVVANRIGSATYRELHRKDFPPPPPASGASKNRA